jgi:uroporphyrinogen decarboxylase
MNAQERVMLALNHKEPDRIPIDLGGSICSSIHRDAYIELKKHLGMDLEEIQMVDYIQQLPYLDEALLERFGVDFLMVQLAAATAPDLNIFEEGDYYAFVDRTGSIHDDKTRRHQTGT